MATRDQNQWIVLLNRAPRGPYSTSEVSQLIAQGHLKRNDLCFCITKNSDQKAIDWKFLWQFEEFQSIQSTTKNFQSSTAHAAAEANQVKELNKEKERRRRKRLEEEQELQVRKKALLKALPEDFVNIRTEDLLVKSHKAFTANRPKSPPTDSKPQVNLAAEYIDTPSWYQRPVFFLILSIVGLGLTTNWFGTTSSNAPKATQEQAKEQVPNLRQTASDKPRRRNVRRPSKRTNRRPPRKRNTRIDVSRKTEIPKSWRSEPEPKDEDIQAEEETDVPRNVKKKEEDRRDFNEDEVEEVEDDGGGEITDFGNGNSEDNDEEIDEDYEYVEEDEGFDDEEYDDE